MNTTVIKERLMLNVLEELLVYLAENSLPDRNAVYQSLAILEGNTLTAADPDNDDIQASDTTYLH